MFLIYSVIMSPSFQLEKKDGKIQQTLKDINKQMEDYQELLQVDYQSFIILSSLLTLCDPVLGQDCSRHGDRGLQTASGN